MYTYSCIVRVVLGDAGASGFSPVVDAPVWCACSDSCYHTFVRYYTQYECFCGLLTASKDLLKACLVNRQHNGSYSDCYHPNILPLSSLLRYCWQGSDEFCNCYTQSHPL